MLDEFSDVELDSSLLVVSILFSTTDLNCTLLWASLVAQWSRVNLPVQEI